MWGVGWCGKGEEEEGSKAETEEERRMNTVYVNVYDMREENAWTGGVGLGVWHSGVELYGRYEITFGGHGGAETGVYSTRPGGVAGPGVKLRERIEIGRIQLSVTQVRHVLERISLEYPGHSYHLLHRNCNHFSDDLCRRLTGGRGLPSFVNRLASLASFFRCWLPSSLALSPPTPPDIPPSTSTSFYSSNSNSNSNSQFSYDQGRTLSSAYSDASDASHLLPFKAVEPDPLLLHSAIDDANFLSLSLPPSSSFPDDGTIVPSFHSDSLDSLSPFGSFMTDDDDSNSSSPSLEPNSFNPFSSSSSH